MNGHFKNCKMETMTINELTLLQSAMCDAENYLEFGAGNSTCRAVETKNIRSITVVESDPVFWEKQILTIPSIKIAYNANRLKPILVDIGPTTHWGYPIDTSCADKWPMYHLCAFQSVAPYDLLLVDGRFRVACILNACLSCKEDTRILIHVFFNRPIYWVVRPFIKLERRADTMGLFSIKKTQHTKLLKEYISIYKNVPEA